MTYIGVTGILGYEKARQLLQEHQQELEQRFSSRFLRQFHQLAEEKQENAPGCRISIGEGGVLAALWEGCETWKEQQGIKGPVGCQVFLDQIPVRQEVIEILELFAENPYECEGGVLCIWEEKTDLPKDLLDIQRKTAIIGYITGTKQRLLLGSESERYLTPPGRQQKDIAYRRQK